MTTHNNNKISPLEQQVVITDLNETNTELHGILKKSPTSNPENPERKVSILSDSSYGSDDLIWKTRRPSTSGTVIQKLHIEKEETGISISGIFVWGNCYIILWIMAGFFIVIGTVLSIISFQKEDEMEKKEPKSDNSYNYTTQWIKRSKIFGPVFIVLGALMLLFGGCLLFVKWKIAQDEKIQHEKEKNTDSAKKRRNSIMIYQLQHGETSGMPTITSLSGGLMATQNVPCLMSYPIASENEEDSKNSSRRNSLQVPSPLDSSLVVDNLHGCGRTTTNELFDSRRNSVPLVYQTSKRYGRRGSTRNSCTINIAKEHLKLLERPSTVAHSNDNCITTNPIFPTGNGNTLQYDVACFPVNENRTAKQHGIYTDESDEMPKVEVEDKLSVEST